MDFIDWRYEKYIKPQLPLDKDLFSLIKRKNLNSKIINNDHLIYYLSADEKNLGDYASAQGVKLLLGVKGLESYVSSRGMKETKSLFSRIKTERKNVHLVVGGGGLLQECFNPFWHTLLDSELKFSLFGVGANELKPGRNLLETSLLHDISGRAQSIHVRDDWTKSLLLNQYNRYINVGFCPALNYLNYKYLNFDQGKETTLLYVDHPSDVNMAGGNSNQIISVLKEVANKLGLDFCYTNHVDESFDSIVSLYKKSKVIVTSRLHGCIFAYSFCKKFIPIICDKKTSELINTHFSNIKYLTMDISTNDTLEIIEGLSCEKYNFNCSEKLIDNYRYALTLKNEILNGVIF